MPISFNNNLMALGVSNNLESHYARLSVSVQRLSSGLRINSAADDAAGLAIRELMRSDVAALNQGMHNASDAISMIQVADGALGVIDEKLIRMKELAEQAATGTYNSTQRLMIDSEFQAMASEIERIARATDFNGIKLLDGSLQGEHDGSGLDSTGKLKVHFGSANDSAEDYYYVEIGDCTLAGLGLREPVAGSNNNGTGNTNNSGNNTTITNTIQMPPLNDDYGYGGPGIARPDNYIDTMQNTIPAQGKWYTTGSNPMNPSSGSHQNFMFIIPKDTKNIVINMLGGDGINTLADNDIQLFTKNGIHLAGTPLNDYVFGNLAGIDNSINGQSHLLGFTQNDYDGSNLNTGPSNYDPTGATLNFTQFNGMTIGYSGDSDQHDTNPNDGIQDTWEDYETLTITEATEDLIVWLPGAGTCDVKVYWDLPDAPPGPGPDPGPNPPQPDQPTPSPQGDIISIKTQEKAQQALERIDDAIVAKDKVRANLGATQNRLENTVTNLTIMAENMLSAESRISDADIGAEMMVFVKNQILTQSSVAMLSQANSWPHMLMSLIGG